MRSTWTGLLLIGVVIYFVIVRPMSSPLILFNAHALTLVIGGTIAISIVSFPAERLLEVFDFIIFGFLFRLKKSERQVVRDLISAIDGVYGRPATFQGRGKTHPFITDGVIYLRDPEYDEYQYQRLLRDRRNAVRRKYVEDAKILNSIAKYPPNLGLLGAASGMIEMLAGLGTSGVDSIGGAMAIALSATLWGIGLNNFVFLPLADNSLKAAEDELFLRDLIADCFIMMRKDCTYAEVLNACFNRLALVDRNAIRAEYDRAQSKAAGSGKVKRAG